MKAIDKWGVIAAGAMLTLGMATAAEPAGEPPGASGPDAAVFDLLEFEVEGNTVLPARVVEQTLMPHMGERRTIEHVLAARAALEAAFQQAGFLTVYVDVPEQQIDYGVVRLVVTEGRVDRLRVTGARYYDQGRIREAVGEFAPGHVPNFERAQEQVAELNRVPTRQIQPVLRPGPMPGTVDVELRVTDERPLSASVELKNHHSADTEPLRLTAGLRVDNLLQRDHALALTAITAPGQPSQSRVLVAAWTAPVSPTSSWLVNLVASDSELEPLGVGTVIGRGATLGVRRLWNYFGPTGVHTLAVGVDAKRLQERFIAGDDVISTPLRYAPLQLGYTAQWDRGGAATSISATYTIAFKQVLQRRIDCPGNVGPVDQFACRRQGADGSFAWLRLDLRHGRPLAGGRLALRLAGQAASQPLTGGEQYSLGGAETVRGYYEGEAVGDHGLMAAAEWRSPNLVAGLDALAPHLSELSLLVFAEAGRVTVLQPLPEQQVRVPLAATGAGLRLRSGRWMSAALDIGWPLKPGRNNPDRDPRVHARVGLQF